MADQTTDPTLWPLRDDKTNKGSGYLGLFPRPDGSVMSEYSVGVPINGKEMDIPTFVPTLSEAEVKSLIASKEGEKIPMSIVMKAAEHAMQRIKAGKSVWAQEGEQQNLYPNIPRAQIKMPHLMNRVEQPTDPNATYKLLMERQQNHWPPFADK